MIFFTYEKWHKSWHLYNQLLSEQFIEKHIDKIDLKDIAYDKIMLSDSFIEKYKNELNWNWLSEIWNLSHEFILNYIEKINFKRLKCNKKIKRIYQFCIGIPLDIDLQAELIQIKKYIDVRFYFK